MGREQGSQFKAGIRSEDFADLAPVVILAGSQGGVAFMDGDPQSREMDVQIWYEPDGVTIKTFQATVRRHPKHGS